MKQNEIMAQFMRPAQACKYLGIGRTMLHGIEKTDSDFPKKIKLSARCVGWRRDQLDSWLEKKQQQAEQTK